MMLRMMLGGALMGSAVTIVFAAMFLLARQRAKKAGLWLAQAYYYLEEVDDFRVTKIRDQLKMKLELLLPSETKRFAALYRAEHNLAESIEEQDQSTSDIRAEAAVH